MIDETEFTALFRAHYTAVRRFIERRVSDRDAADDLTMDCFEIAWRKRTPDQPYGLAWLYRTARNLIANEYRRRDREEALWMQIEQHVRTLSSPADAESAQRLLDAVRSLPEQEREILWLTYWEELSAADVALVMGLTPGSVWTRLTRIRTRLRPLLVDGALVRAEHMPRVEVRDDRR